ncbi:chromate efflux transporter [soil metagenome]
MLKSALEVFLIFLKLGFTSFGGPVAHLGFFHSEFVLKRKWYDEHSYADLVALCQFLPGPASSQVGMAIGLSRAGVAGAVAAWIGFTLPSALLLVCFAFGVAALGSATSGPWLHGLKIAAVAVVAQALWAMSAKLCPDKERATIAILATGWMALFSSVYSQVIAIAAGAVIGWFLLRKSGELPHKPIQSMISRTTGAIFLSVFVLLLACLPLLAASADSHALKLFDSFYRAGSLVFGGGHVVLPLLQAEVVPQGWVTNDAFMAGYGAAQAIPGPLFSFTAYLGAVSKVWSSGWLGALVCLVAAFLPSFLLITGALPFWEQLRRFKHMRYAMQGINAAVVGLLISAFYNPVWTSAIRGTRDFSLALTAFVLLVFWKAPSWLVVFLSALVGGLFF